MPTIQIQFRRGTAQEWTVANPILAIGELGLELDTSKFKIGTGTARWVELTYGGIKGDTGAKGNKGDTGAQGPKGDTGDTGAKGDTGTGVVLKGAAPLVTALPVDGNNTGDLVLVLEDNNGYMWGGSTWINIGSIRGPQGEIGPKGDTGDKGDAGEQGLPGPKGDKGDTGQTGDTGTQGPQGEQGVKGDTGDTGPQGTPGTLAPQVITVVCGDEQSPIAQLTSIVTLRMPFSFALSSIRASLTNAQTEGDIVTVDVQSNGTSIFTTPLTIDNLTNSSKNATVPAVLATTALADDDELTVNVVQVGNGTASGLKVYLIGAPT